MSQTKRLKATSGIKARYLISAGAFFLIAFASVNFVIASNNQKAEYVTAGRDLPAGNTLALADTKLAEVNLGSSAAQYLQAGELPSGSYLLGPVREGQLIPLSMIANSIIDERVPVVVNSAMGLPAGLVSGSSVDLWVTPIVEDKSFGEPYALILGAEVASVINSEGMFAESNPAVELWVPIEAVGPVLEAISKGDSISLILRPTLADG